jgi:hypothetical protein
MTPPTGFETGRKAKTKGPLTEIRPAASLVEAGPEHGARPHRAADYAYRIAALTAGLILLATVM